MGQNKGGSVRISECLVVEFALVKQCGKRGTAFQFDASRGLSLSVVGADGPKMVRVVACFCS